MGQETEASQESFTQRLIEGSQPEQRGLGIVELFVARNVSFETILEDVTRMRLLHKHAKMGDVTVIQQLRNRADANATTVGGFTPLHLAAAMGHIDVVDEFLLLDHWPNLKVEVATSDGITALHLAAYGGYDSIVISLLQRYEKNSAADVNARDNVLGTLSRALTSALHYAVGGGHQNIVEQLIRFPGIYICPRDSVQNLTPLLMEVMKPRGICNLVLVRKLIDAWPDQINHAVGTDPKPIDTEPWRAFCPIELFTSDKVLQRGSGLCPKKQSADSQQGTWREYKRIEEEMRKTDGSLSEVEWERKDTRDRQRLEAESKKLDAESKWFTSSKFSAPLRNSNGGIIMDRYLMY
ncbi:hypothetical protein Mapa_006159 [Marchantia paleacea]|nr:hypothetical protein Mapa_006159 [Marchantia paleacea]